MAINGYKYLGNKVYLRMEGNTLDPDLNVQNKTSQLEYHQENSETLQYNLQELRANQSLSKGFTAGIVAAITCAALWAMITVATEYQIGWMAVGVGYLVGFAIRFAGKGVDQIFGITGAMLALFGCILGNVLTIYMFIAKEYTVPVASVFLQLDTAEIIDMLIESFNPIDLIFYAIALIEGFRFSTISIKPKTEAD